MSPSIPLSDVGAFSQAIPATTRSRRAFSRGFADRLAGVSKYGGPYAAMLDDRADRGLRPGWIAGLHAAWVRGWDAADAITDPVPLPPRPPRRRRTRPDPR